MTANDAGSNSRAVAGLGFRAALAVVGLLEPAVLTGQAVVSQVYGGGGNTGATLRNDFIEIFNRGTSPINLTGWSVQYAPATGDTWDITPLAGVLAPGRYYLIQQAAGAGGSQALPAPDAVGTAAMSATAGKVALVEAGGGVVDLAGYGVADRFEGAPVRALSNTTAALRRNSGCTDTDNNSADFAVGPPAPRNSMSPPVDCMAVPPAPERAVISRIQGPGRASPLAGRVVETTGIVTARRSNGFYIQSLPEDDDQDPSTSEGLLVFTSGAPPADARAGAVVRVFGTVTEFRSASDPASPTLTEITSPLVEVIGGGRTLPEPVPLTRAEIFPAAGPEALERFEGMRVRLDRLMAASPSGATRDEATDSASDNGVFYAVLDGTPRPVREPGGDFDGNPERLRIDTGALEGAARVPMRAGAWIEGAIGIVDYAFRTYSILAESAGPVTQPEPGDAWCPAPAQTFSAVSVNLRRLYDAVDDPSTSDVVLTAAAFQARLDRIAAIFRERACMADVIAVQEAENLRTLEALAQRLGPQYRAFLEEGNDPSGIDVGFLVHTQRVTVLAVTQEGKNAGFHDRPPLVLEARVAGLRFRAINVHLRSLINIETPQVQARRLSQARDVAQLAARLESSYRGDGLMILGDFNSFPFHNGYDDLLSLFPALHNLTLALAPDEAYTFLHDGNAQALDHVLINGVLRARWESYRIARVNAGFPETARFSDHDVPVAAFFLDPAAMRISSASVTNAASFRSTGAGPGEIITIFGRDLGPAAPVGPRLTPDGAGIAREAAGTRVLFGDAAAPLLYVSESQVTAVAPMVGGARQVRVDSGGRVTNAVDLAGGPLRPAVFAAGNQEGVAVIYLTGLGTTTPRLADGTFGTAAHRVEGVHVWIGGRAAEILYAGAAPGLAAGLYQVNARMPAGLEAGAEVLVVFQGRTSQPGVTIGASLPDR